RHLAAAGLQPEAGLTRLHQPARAGHEADGHRLLPGPGIADLDGQFEGMTGGGAKPIRLHAGKRAIHLMPVEGEQVPMQRGERLAAADEVGEMAGPAGSRPPVSAEKQIGLDPAIELGTLRVVIDAKSGSVYIVKVETVGV